MLSCATIDVPDVPVFKKLSNSEAYYIYTLSDREGLVNDATPFFDPAFMKEPQTWRQLQVESVVLPAFSYGEIAIFTQKVCKKYKKECQENGNPEERIKPFLSDSYVEILKMH